MVGLEATVLCSGVEFLLNPTSLRALSASLHLVLLLLLIVSWVCKNIKTGDLQNTMMTGPLYYKQIFICCLGLSGSNLLLCFLNYFYWYENGWSDEKLAILLDLVLRTLAWGAVCVFMHSRFLGSTEPKFPFLLRFWWGIYFSISCYCLPIDIVKQYKYEPLQFLVPDTVYAMTGLFLCYSGIWRKSHFEDSDIEEPLLNGSAD